MGDYLNIPQNVKPLSDQQKQANKSDIAKTFQSDDRPLADRVGDLFSAGKRKLAEGMAKAKAATGD